MIDLLTVLAEETGEGTETQIIMEAQAAETTEIARRDSEVTMMISETRSTKAGRRDPEETKETDLHKQELSLLTFLDNHSTTPS
jgi:hypothetical protein